MAKAIDVLRLHYECAKKYVGHFYAGGTSRIVLQINNTWKEIIENNTVIL
jgi:hypothetical protein